LVNGSAVQAFEHVCPERIDLIHKNYRRLCNLLVDIDEWGQVTVLNMLTRYARSQFVDPNKVLIKTKKKKEKYLNFYFSRHMKMKKKIFMKMKQRIMVMKMKIQMIKKHILWIVIIVYYYDVQNHYYKVEIQLYVLFSKGPLDPFGVLLDQ